MEHIDWGTFILAACAVVTVILGYFRHPSLVSSGRLDDLQQVVDELRSQNADLRRERDELQAAFRNSERSRAFWQDRAERYERELRKNVC